VESMSEISAFLGTHTEETQHTKPQKCRSSNTTISVYFKTLKKEMALINFVKDKKSKSK
jgi:hypothetical protein